LTQCRSIGFFIFSDEQAEKNMAILLDRLAVWGGWPLATEEWKEDKFDWKKLLVDLIRTTGEAPLLSIYVIPDRHNTSLNVISIDQVHTMINHMNRPRDMKG